MAKSKNDIKDANGVKSDKSVTFKEFFNALKELGYEDVSTPTHLRFQKVANSVLSMPMRPLTDKMQMSDFRTYAYIIYMKGDIENAEDLDAIIEKNRHRSEKTSMALA
jgi:hypothetical protein